MKRAKQFGLLVILLSLFIHSRLQAAGTVVNPTEADLRAALAGGGTVTFACDGTILLTSTLTITNATAVDASGHSVTISGNNTVRVFTVTNSVTLSLMNLRVANGLAAGTNGAAGVDGSTAQGGGVYVNGGTLLAANCQFVANAALGGNGGANYSSNGGNGGAAFGGAIDVNGGALGITNCQFYGNVVNGGTGGQSDGGFSAGAGGESCGGAIHFGASAVFLQGCRFETNQSIGGVPGITPGFFGPPGGGFGGAVCQNGGSATMNNCVFVGNAGSSASPLSSLNGSGGPALGGAVYSDAQLALAGGTFTSNNVVGGRAGLHNGAPGLARGGAVYSIGPLLLANCVLGQNSTLGAIGSYTGGGGSSEGGALYNGGTAILNQSWFLSNSARGANNTYIYTTGGSGNGGAIENVGAITVVGCTFSDNKAFGLDEMVLPTSGSGGALYNGGSCMITNSTVTGNLALGGSSTGGSFNGANALGAGIYQSNGVLYSVNNTIAGNIAQPGTGLTNGAGLGGGICSSNGTVSLLNTIVANSVSSGNGYGALTDLGHNLSSDASCNFTGPGSLNNTDPKLAPLDNYGGPTFTMALLAGSPAIDAGDPANFPPTDQRGHARPYGSAPDIGAFESSPPFTIHGMISGRTLQSEVSVTAGSSTVGTANHAYGLLGLAPSVYGVTPQSPDYVFIPASRSVTVGPDQVGIDFKAYRWNVLSLDEVTNNTMHVIFAGTNGLTYRLQNSPDLRQWSTGATYTIGSTNYWEMFLPVSSSGSLFYRTATP